MALLPTLEANTKSLLGEDYSIDIYPSKTYCMELANGRIRGKVTDYNAMQQVVYCILNTERFRYLAYSGNYGVELEDLFGMPMSYVIPELERRITEALVWDTRINSVDGFKFEIIQHAIHVTFITHTIYGDIEAEKVVKNIV